MTTKTEAEVERRRERVERLEAELRAAERQLETAEQALAAESDDDDGPRYPDIHVQLTGQDGNAFTMITRVMGDMRRAKVPVEERDEFMAETTSGDYDHVLQTIMRWVDVS